MRVRFMALVVGLTCLGCEPTEGGELCDDLNDVAPECPEIICGWRRHTACDPDGYAVCVRRVQDAYFGGATCTELQSIVSDDCRPGCF